MKAVSIEVCTFRPGTYPNRSAIVDNCLSVSWAEVAELTGLKSLAEVDIGLRTNIGGLNAKYSNEEYGGKLVSLLQSDRVLSPPEGQFSDLLHDIVLGAIQNLGHDWVWVGNEFGTERKLHWIEDLKKQDSNVTRGGPRNVFTPDLKLLWTTHWDSHFSFLCSSYEALDRIRRKYRFEGFFCTAETKVFWSVLS